MITESEFYILCKLFKVQLGHDTPVPGEAGYFEATIAFNTSVTNPLSAFYNITATNPGLFVELPAMSAENSISPGEDVVFYNPGSIEYEVVNTNAVHVAFVQPGQFVRITKTDDTSVPGVFIVETLGTSGMQQSDAVDITGHVVLDRDATQAFEAVTYQQFLAVVSGLTVKAPCRAATTAAVTATYNNGSSGVGATLTFAGSIPAIGGVSSFSINDSILIKDQVGAAKIQNGIYSVTSSTVLTRRTDYDTALEVIPGSYTNITEGDNANLLFGLMTPAPIVIGTTQLTFSPIGLVTAGPGLVLISPNTIAMPDIVTGTTLNNAAKTFNLTFDNRGLINSVTLIDILIAQSQVTGLVAALAALQPLAPILTGLTSMGAGTGLVVQSAAAAFIKRVVAAGSSKISVTDGDGVAGNIIIDVVQSALTLAQSQITGLTAALAALQPLAPILTALAGMGAGTGLVIQSATSAFVKRSIVAANSKVTVTNGDGVGGNVTLDILDSALIIAQSQITGLAVTLAALQPLATLLTALASMGTGTGLVVQNGASTVTKRSVVAGSSAVSVTNGDGVSGNISVDVIQAALILAQSQITGLVAALAAKLALAGGTMTGALALVANAVNPLEAVPLQQLNAAIIPSSRFTQTIGPAITGNQTLDATFFGTTALVNLTSASVITFPNLTILPTLAVGTWGVLENKGNVDATINHSAGDVLETATYLLGPGARMYYVLEEQSGGVNVWRVYGGTLLVPEQFTKTLDGTVINATYCICDYIPFDFVALNVSGKGTAGTATATFSFNGTNITGGALAVSTTDARQGLTALNTVSRGGALNLVISGVSSFANGVFTVDGYRRFNI